MSAAAALVVFLASAGAAVAAVRPPVYESTSAIVLQQPELLRRGGLGVIIKLNQLRLHYVALIDSDAVTGPAATQLGLRRAQVAAAVTAAAPEQSLLLYPTAQARSPEKARLLARAVTTSLVAYANAEQTSARISANDRVVLNVVDDAARAKKVAPSSERVVATSAFGAVAAIFVMAALAQVPGIRRLVP